ncbi:hypothetical protein PHMEG_00033014, partial [Phytophthora megakarya]
ERDKIVHKLLPAIRKGERINYKEIGAPLNPFRSAKTIKKDSRHGSLWDQRGRPVQPEHEPIRVNRRVQDLRAEKETITDGECADARDIPRGSFSELKNQIRDIPFSKISFSFGNPDFAPQVLRTLRLSTSQICITVFSFTHLGIAGILLDKLAET